MLAQERAGVGLGENQTSARRATPSFTLGTTGYGGDRVCWGAGVWRKRVDPNGWPRLRSPMPGVVLGQGSQRVLWNGWLPRFQEYQPANLCPVTCRFSRCGRWGSTSALGKPRETDVARGEV